MHDEGKHGPSRDPTKCRGSRCVWCEYITPSETDPAETQVGGDRAPSQPMVEEDEVRCLLYTPDAADDLLCVDPGRSRIHTKNKHKQ